MLKISAICSTCSGFNCGSSENSLVIVDDVYEDAIAALGRAGAYRCSAAEKDLIEEKLWIKDKLAVFMSS